MSCPNCDNPDCEGGYSLRKEVMERYFTADKFDCAGFLAEMRRQHEALGYKQGFTPEQLRALARITAQYYEDHGITPPYALVNQQHETIRSKLASMGIDVDALDAALGRAIAIGGEPQALH